MRGDERGLEGFGDAFLAEARAVGVLAQIDVFEGAFGPDLGEVEVGA